MDLQSNDWPGLIIHVNPDPKWLTFCADCGDVSVFGKSHLISVYSDAGQYVSHAMALSFVGFVNLTQTEQNSSALGFVIDV